MNRANDEGWNEQVDCHQGGGGGGLSIAAPLLLSSTGNKTRFLRIRLKSTFLGEHQGIFIDTVVSVAPSLIALQICDIRILDDVTKSGFFRRIKN